MRIAIVNLTGGGLSGGYATYLKNIVPRLARNREVDSILCVSPEGIDVRAWFEGLANVELAACRKYALGHLAGLPDRKLRRRIGSFGPDVVFFPLDRYLAFGPIPVLNMLRNMEPFIKDLKGDPVRERVKKAVLRRLSRYSLGHASHTIAVSGFVEDLVTTAMRIPPEKVSRVYHGVTPPSGTKPIRPAKIPAWWDTGFFFTAGSLRPARGLEDALEAMSYLRARGQDARLLIAGQASSAMRRYKARLDRAVLSRGLTDRICWIGDLSDGEMAWCYERCRAFLMTSRVEACPNVALEAMSRGCVSVSTDSSPMPEIFEDAAVYYHEQDGKGLGSAIERIAAWAPARRNEIRRRAEARAADLSWDRCAERTLAAMKKAVHYRQQRHWTERSISEE